MTSDILRATERAERELPEVIGQGGDLLAGVGPALAGLSTAGSLAGAGQSFASGRPGSGILQLAGAAGAFPGLLRRFPELADLPQGIARGFTSLVPSGIGAGASAVAETAPVVAASGAETAAQLGAQGLGDVGDIAPGFVGGDVGNVLQGLGIAAGLANIGLSASKGDALGSARNAAVLAAQFAGPEVGIPVAIGNALISLFTGGKGGGGGKVDVQVPGYAFPIKQTAGGAQTSFASYREGQGAIGPFQKAVSAAKNPEELVAALNQPYSPFPGQFQVYATEPGGVPTAIRNYDAGPTTRRFTLADLENPDVLKTIGVQAGALGAPAEQPALAQSLREFIPAKLAEFRQTSTAALPAPAPPAVPPGAAGPPPETPVQPEGLP